MTGEGRPQDITPRRARASCGIVKCGEPIPLLTSPRGAQVGNWLHLASTLCRMPTRRNVQSLHGALAARFLDLDRRLVQAVEVLSVPLVANPTSGTDCCYFQCHGMDVAARRGAVGQGSSSSSPMGSVPFRKSVAHSSHCSARASTEPLRMRASTDCTNAIRR